MKKEIKIPDIAENVDTGVIGRILVSKGDEVKKDQPVVEVETDKAATDIPSPFEGTIDEIKVEEGDEVSVHQVIMIVEVAGEASGDGDDDDEGGSKGEGDEEPDEKEDQEDKGEKEDQGKSEEPLENEEKEGQDSDGGDEDEHEDEKEDRDADEKTTSDKKTAAEDIAAAPSVRRMAREAGVDLSEIDGTGPGNRITAEDIQSAGKGKGDQAADDKKKEKKDSGSHAKEGARKREEAIELPDFSQWGDTKKEKMNTVRRITARTMTASWQQIPQVTQFDEADITDIEAFRQKNKDDYDKKGGNLTVTAILLKIAAFGLQKFPRFNSSLDTSDNSLVMKQYINIGLAVDTDKGLIVPVIRDTDKKSLEKISIETVELAKKARESEISLDELQGGNFTISNLGGIGGTGFTPIVYAPQVAILGVSRASYKQVFREDRFQQRLVLPLSLTYDHRVIDGAEGARFLRWICEVLDDPYALLQ